MPGSERLERSVAFVRERQFTGWLGLCDLCQSSRVSTRFAVAIMIYRHIYIMYKSVCIYLYIHRGFVYFHFTFDI